MRSRQRDLERQLPDRIYRRFVGARGRQEARPDHLGWSLHHAARAGMPGLGRVHPITGRGHESRHRPRAQDAWG